MEIDAFLSRAVWAAPTHAEATTWELGSPGSTGSSLHWDRGMCVTPSSVLQGAPWDHWERKTFPPPQGLGSKPLLPNWPAGSSVSHLRPQPPWAGCLRTHGHQAALGPPPGLQLWEKTADSVNPAPSAGVGTPRAPLACRNRVTSSPPCAFSVAGLERFCSHGPTSIHTPSPECPQAGDSRAALLGTRSTRAEPEETQPCGIVSLRAQD